MRTLVTALLVGIPLVAGPALAQQHPWVPSGFNGPAGSLPNGAPAVIDQHPWVSGNVYLGNLPNGAPAYAARAVPANAQASKRPATR